MKVPIMNCEVKIKGNKIFAPLRDKWLVLKPEEKVRQEYICRLINHYNFSLDQMAQEKKVSNSQRGQGRAMADIVIWKSKKDKTKHNSPAIVVECKAEHLTIREEDYFQGFNYAAWAGADFFVTTNLKETRIFKVTKGKMPKRLEEILDIPNSDTVDNDKEIKKLLKQTKAFTRDEFSRLLFKCHNIIRNNDKLSPEAAFDEISKVLFMKIRYERNPDEENIFSLKQFQRGEVHHENNIRPSLKGTPKDLPYIQFLFDRTKDEFKEDDLFEDNEQIRIRKSSFEDIVKELQIYNLSTTSDDIKGIAFERFLGKTFRGELGQFFTPRTIVDFMVEVLDPQEGEIICDPCCGSGGFLIKAFEYVRAKIEQDIHRQKDKFKKQLYTDDYQKMPGKKQEIIDNQVNELFSKLNTELDTRKENSRLNKLSSLCIFGTDANPRMARTSKMNMIMHGDGHGGVHHNDGLLNVNGVFENRFDMILTNPPFGSRVDKSLKITEADKFTDQAKISKYQDRYDEAYDEAMKQITDHIGESLLSLYKTGKMSGLTEVLFIERCLNLLQPGGRMGIVLPDGVLNTDKLQKVRSFVESKAKIILITSIPQDVFIASGATVKPSLLFFKKFTEAEAQEYDEITKKANKKTNKKYTKRLTVITNKLALKGKDAPKAEEKKELRKKLKKVNEDISEEITKQVKEEFDYQIPIAEVEKAGISPTGSKIENELIPLQKEYAKYWKKNKLWANKFDSVKYEIMENSKLFRVVSGKPEKIDA